MATDFFDRQDAARRQTTWLVILFVLGVAALVLALDLLLVVVFGALSQTQAGGSADARPSGAVLLDLDPHLAADPLVLAVATGATLLIVGGGSAYKIAELWAGGHVVAEQLGGRRVRPDSADAGERRLLNVVEEMAIASGTPTPPVYLLDGEEGINAFAAGHTMDDAIIGMTRGAVRRLSRDELQGVVAHEFSHVLHGDMRLNIRLIGVLHGVLLVGLLGHLVLRSSFYAGMGRRRGREGSAAVVLLVLGGGLIVVGFVGTFFGSLIKAAVSRQREFLADASAVQFTRSPSGIAGALKKIGGVAVGSAVSNPAALQASHLFFGRAVSGLTSLFSTHPPLAERIRRLDPTWDGRFVSGSAETSSIAARPPGAPGFAAGGGLATAVRQIGETRDVHIAYAADLVAQLPRDLVAAAREPYSARALVYALVIDRRAAIRQRQLDYLAREADPGLVEATTRMNELTARLAPAARLPLVEMAVPALDLLTESQDRAFRHHLEALVAADDRLAVFEWTLQRMLVRQLAAHRGGGARRPRGRGSSLASMRGPCLTLLSTLARVGHAADADAARAFDRAWSVLRLSPARLAAADRCGLASVDRALEVLEAGAPSAKRSVLEAAAACIESDLAVTAAEVELVRAVAVSLGCPMPPLAGSMERAGDTGSVLGQGRRR